jgi:IS30 family transposase
MRSELTKERAEEAARLVAEGLTLDAVAARLGVHRRTILRWVERDPAFRACYEEARRTAHQGLYDELQQVLARTDGSRPAAYAARRRLMRRAPKKHGKLPPEQRPCLLYQPRPRRSDGA